MEVLILELKLVGGLGNQLHGIAAGIAISEFKQIPVRFNAQQIPFGSNPGRRLIVDQLDLGVKDLKIADSRYAPFLGYLFSASDKFRIPIRRLHQERGEVWRDSGAKPSDLLPQIPDSGKIVGHFLDFQWAELAIRGGMKFQGLRRPLGLEAEKLLKQITPESIAIHARFGDFKKNKSLFPILDLNFYQRALLNFDTSNDYWLFTDDIKSAREILGTSFMSRLRVIPGKRIKDIEAFFLLSNFKQIVTSNSTFSSWAAFFAEKNWQSKVVTPIPHMYGEWEDRLPSTWTRIGIFQ